MDVENRGEPTSAGGVPQPGVPLTESPFSAPRLARPNSKHTYASLFAGSVACLLWTIFVGWPVIIYHAINDQFTVVDHVHAAVLMAISEVLVFWLVAGLARRYDFTRRVAPARPVRVAIRPRIGVHGTGMVATRVAIIRSWLRPGVVACVIWTILVCVPVFIHHLRSAQFSTGEHIHTGVLILISEAMIYWIVERRYRRPAASKR
jgi:hypothetical protein